MPPAPVAATAWRAARRRGARATSPCTASAAEGRRTSAARSGAGRRPSAPSERPARLAVSRCRRARAWRSETGRSSRLRGTRRAASSSAASTRATLPGSRKSGKSSGTNVSEAMRRSRKPAATTAGSRVTAAGSNPARRRLSGPGLTRTTGKTARSAPRTEPPRAAVEPVRAAEAVRSETTRTPRPSRCAAAARKLSSVRRRARPSVTGSGPRREQGGPSAPSSGRGPSAGRRRGSARGDPRGRGGLRRGAGPG